MHFKAVIENISVVRDLVYSIYYCTLCLEMTWSKVTVIENPVLFFIWSAYYVQCTPSVGVLFVYNGVYLYNKTNARKNFKFSIFTDWEYVIAPAMGVMLYFSSQH